jgi:GH18 family chitinase
LSSLPWNAITQVDLFSLSSCVSSGDPESDCTGPTSIDTEYNGVSDPASFVSAVHAGGKLAIITIGGSTNPNWYYPCNGSNAAVFAQNLVNYMQSNGFDGVDLDIEQDTTTGSPAFSAADLQACAEDVYNDAKAIRTQAGNTPIVTADVDPTTDYDIGQIEEPYVDQFNAMSYGATGSTLASQINALETQSDIPASKITEGVDIQDYPSTRADCGSNASWAASNGLAGAMLWFGQYDAPSYTCLDAVAPYIH